MDIQITLSVIRIRIRLCSQKHEIFLQTKTVDLALQLFSQFSLSKNIPSGFYTMIFEDFHCINRNLICLLCCQPSNGENPLPIIGIFKSSRKFCFPSDFFLIYEVMKYICILAALRIHLDKAFLHFIGHCKNPVKIQITISVQFSGVTGVFIIYM